MADRDQAGGAATRFAYLALIALTFANAGASSDAISAAAAVVFCIIIFLERRRISRTQKVLGAVLISIGILCAATAAAPMAVILEGVRRAQLFVLLFAAVGCLQYPAQLSPSLAAARRALAGYSPNRQFLSLSTVVHATGSVLNLLAVSLFSDALRTRQDTEGRRRLARAILGGFLTASCWSPYFLGMTVVQVVYPDVRWAIVLPLGLALALALNLSNWGLACFQSRASIPATAEPLPWALADKLRLFCLMGALSLTVIALIKYGNVSAPVAIGLLAPPFGLVWTIAITVRGRRRGSVMSARAFACDSLDRLPSLRNETLLFLGANIMAAGVAVAVPQDLLANALGVIAPGASAKIIAIIMGMAALGLAGLHPVVIVVLVAQVTDPARIGVSIEVMAFILLAMWGITTALSPLSGVSLFTSRIAEVSSWTLAWRWNAPPALGATVIVAVAAVAMNAVLQ